MTRALATGNTGEEHLKTRLLGAATLLATSIVTILLLSSDRAPWTNSGHFYRFVTSKRATVQIIVQILSQGFGALNAYAFCSLINLGTRLRLARTPYTLDQLQFWSAITLQRLDWALPLGLIIILMLFNVMIRVPGAIWAGALTPVVTSTHSSSTPLLEVPQYGPASAHIWGDLTWLAPEPSIHNPSGIFSYSPNYDLLGLILTQAASASNIGNATQPVRKLDNTRYSYVGRSYGVGSSVGLVDESFVQNTTQGYQYNENGYSTQVQCVFNRSSDWNISDTIVDSPSALPNLYLVAGTLANGNSEKYGACGLGSPDNIFALVGSSKQNNNVFAIAAGHNYGILDKVQCTVDFTPAEFQVSVNRTERLITVELLANGSVVRDIEPTGNLSAITMRMPTSFSQQHACDLYTSLLGNTFLRNIDVVANNDDHALVGNTTARVLRGVQDSLTSMLDNTLLAFSSAQLMIPHDVYTVPVSLTSSAVRIGESAYIYAVAAVNFAIVVLSLSEVMRTRIWKGLSRFDFTDVRSLVVGVAKGGTVIAEEAEKVGVQHDAGDLTQNSEDRALGRIRVRLESLGTDTRLVGIRQEQAFELKKGTKMWDQDKKTGSSDSELESLRREENGRDQNNID